MSRQPRLECNTETDCARPTPIQGGGSEQQSHGTLENTFANPNMLNQPSVKSTQASDWDTHWKSLDSDRRIFSFLSLATRRLIFEPTVAFYTRRFFPPKGIFVEMGCGTAESSAKVDRRERKLIGLDFSEVALRAAQNARRMDGLLQADMFATPCRANSIDGIWNLGVMEHFTDPQLRTCLREFRRVLRPGGILLLFWPAENNASRWVLGPPERLIRWRRGTEFTFFPGEVSRLRSKHQARLLLASEGFSVKTIEFNWRTAFIHMVIAATAE